MDTHESSTEASANQMLCDLMNMRKEDDESVRDYVSRIQDKLNRLDALLSERGVDLSALLQKNRMLEIIGVDYPALREQLFLAEGYRPNNWTPTFSKGPNALTSSEPKLPIAGNRDAASAEKRIALTA